MKSTLFTAAAALFVASAASAFAQAPNDIASKLREGKSYTEGHSSPHARASQNTPGSKHAYSSRRASGSRHVRAESSSSAADHSADDLNARELKSGS